MRSPFATLSPNFPTRMIAMIIGFGIAVLALTSVANAQIDGFTAPFKSIELSSDETGAISEMNVAEGDTVSEGGVIARLDSRVQKLQVEIASHLANSTSQLEAANKALQKRETIMQRLTRLNASGHASNSEIIRAEMEVSIAQSKYLAAKEDQAVREVELRRAQVQLDRRTITAPFNGVVAKVHRDQGEFLSPIKPEIVTLVQVDRLFATFAIESSQISTFKVGKVYNLELANGNTVAAEVFSIGVETDATSGTIEVKFVIDNSNGQIRSGEACKLNI